MASIDDKVKEYAEATKGLNQGWFMSNLLPRAFQAAQSIIPIVPRNIKTYEVLDKQEQGDACKVRVRFKGDTEAIIESTWEQVGGAWKIADFAAVR